jgi:bacteriochlorophyllide a dehydrogenase
MNALAIVMSQPRQLQARELGLAAPGDADLEVEVEHSGISTGTERLLYTGAMPPFPGMGYPLVPGYEAVGRVVRAGSATSVPVGQRVFVPGAHCFTGVHCLFGAAASRLVVPASRITPVSEALGAEAVLLALAATAQHSVAGRAADAPRPELIVGHGVLGRLLARLNLAAGFHDFTVWETDPARRTSSAGYAVCAPEEDTRRDYRAIYDVSGDSDLLDKLVARLAPGGEVVLAGFYTKPLHLDFVPAFMREARLRVAAQWKPDDMRSVAALIEAGRLPLDGLVTHHARPEHAPEAYEQAFGDTGCLKMVLDWRYSA